MTTRPEIVNFNAVLGPFLVAVSEAARPAFLSELERFAADRYRDWAEQCPQGDADALRGCATREDEIADLVSRLLPADEGEEEKMQALMPRARETYAKVFGSLSLRDKYFVQAGAERQGATAWRAMASLQADPELARELERCAQLEEASATTLERLLGLEEGATRLP